MITTDAMAEHNFLGDMLRRMNRRKLMIVMQTLAIFAVLFVAIEMLPRSYQAASLVSIEGQTPAVSQNADVVRDMPFDDFTMGTEVRILNSRELLTDAIERIGLLNKPEFNPNIRAQGSIGQSVENLRDSLANWLPNLRTDVHVSPSEKAMADTLITLRKHTILAPDAHSRVIEIKVSANNNQLAGQIANTIADLYIASHRAYRQAASSEAHQFLFSKVVELRRDADAKAAALEQYRIENGLTAAMTSTLVQEQVSGLSSVLQSARAHLADLEARANQASKSQPTELASVLNNLTINKLREQEASYAAERDRLAASYGPNSRVLSRVEAQLSAVRGQITAEAQRSVRSLPNEVAAARSNVGSLLQRLSELKAQASRMDEARAHLATLEADSQSAHRVLDSFLERMRMIDASMAYGATDVRVISHASPPLDAAFPNTTVMLPAAFILALLTSGATAYLTTRPQGLLGTSHVETFFPNTPMLGMIPTRTPRLVDHFETAIEHLLNRLTMLDNQPRSILITSALPEEGKTTTARALADAALRRGRNVLLVDADMRSARRLKPRTTVQIIGLGDVLRGDVDLEGAITGGNSGGVPMLRAGSPRGNPTQLMALPSLGQMMQQVTLSYDLVIIDAPPALVGGDCEMLTRHADTTLMLAKWASTQPDTIMLALKQLGPKAKVAGMVLTMVDPDKIWRYGQTEAVVFSKKLYQSYRA